eukprot:5758372-Lingulodinium_polyedra.AAC.1
MLHPSVAARVHGVDKLHPPCVVVTSRLVNATGAERVDGRATRHGVAVVDDARTRASVVALQICAPGSFPCHGH